MSVVDDGPGIDAEDLPHIFQPLYRADDSRSRQTGGSGLGLTIARRAVVAHGGRLEACSREERGPEFTIRLPAGGMSGSQSEVAVSEVAAAHLAALETQIRTLLLRQAVLRAAARRGPSLEEIELMHKLARLSDQERRRIVVEFIEDVRWTTPLWSDSGRAGASHCTN